MGRDIIPITPTNYKGRSKTVKTEKVMSYGDCEPDIDGWVDAKKYLPVNYDLVWARIEDRKYSGWWNGTFFECHKMKHPKPILYWKHRKELI